MWPRLSAEATCTCRNATTNPRLRTPPRRSDSIPKSRWRTPIAAAAIVERETITRLSPTPRGRSNSIRSVQWPTAIAAWQTREIETSPRPSPTQRGPSRSIRSAHTRTPPAVALTHVPADWTMRWATSPRRFVSLPRTQAHIRAKRGVSVEGRLRRCNCGRHRSHSARPREYEGIHHSWRRIRAKEDYHQAVVDATRAIETRSETRDRLRHPHYGPSWQG